MEQRAKAAGKASAAAVYRKYINSVKKDEVDRSRIRDLVETEFSKLGESDSEGLRKWFGRKGEKGSKSGWVDCNTCRKDKKTGRKKCSACGRSSGEKRAKYPKCRPTPSACSKPGNYGKKSKAGKKG
jgi:formylmethanofuran dehydrogenase subunit E